MFRFVSTLFIASLIILNILIVSGCSGGGGTDSDGDACVCDPPLECVNGACACPIGINCCINNDDCPTGKFCDTTTNLCEIPVPDGDKDEDEAPDGDDPDGDNPDGDNPDGDQDDDLGTDGDTDENTDGDVDGDIDGDTDGTASDDYPNPQAVEALTRLDWLPYFRINPSTHLEQNSSRDPLGANQDNSWTNLYLDGGEQVLMHSKRPGCIYRIWLGEPNSISTYRIKFYFEGEDAARINTTVGEFFAGETSPFLAPLVGRVPDGPSWNDSFYSYVPICYREEMKVTISGLTHGFSFGYHTYAEAGDLETFTLDMDVSQAVNALNNVGQDPKPTTSPDHPSATVQVPAQGSVTVFENFAARTINGMYLDLTPFTQEVLDQTWLDIYWEGKSTPDVSVPIGLFFGSGFGQVEFQSLMVGMSESGQWYCYFPMPYWDEVLIKIRNESATMIQQLEFNLDLGPNDYPRSVGHFHAKYAEALPTTIGQDFKALDTVGQGHVVGITLATESESTHYYKDFLQGDERFIIDGMTYPLVIGTGTDNFFNGNNLWQAPPYEHPLFSVWKNAGYPTFQFTARRLFLSDALPFYRSISLGFEVGGENDKLANYRSVVYYYLSCLEGITARSAADMVDLGNTLSMSNHNFTDAILNDLYAHQNVTSSFEGESWESTFTASGRGVTGTANDRGFMAMDFAINPENEGVRLVRLFDYKYRNMDAIVQIKNLDDSYTDIGHWYSPGQNVNLRWREGIFDIPKQYTEGKSQIRLKFDYQGGEEWNAYELYAYSILPLDKQSEGPGKVENFGDTTYVGLTACLHWDTPDGTPPAYYHVYRSSSSQVFDCSDLSFLATTSETEYCDDTLDSESTYFYRVQAEDCTGQRSICSNSLEVVTGVRPVCFEAEDTVDFDSTTNGAAEIQTRDGYSNNQLVYFDGTSTFQKLVLKTDDILDAGTYRITVHGMKGPAMGIWMLSVGSTTLGSNQDGYAASEEPWGPLEIGDRYIYPFDGEGDPTSVFFQFRLVDKNALSTSYDVAIDKVCLGQVTD